ncbi:MAG: hypothetical protein VB875_17135, partial [Pirellulales bacterium]
AVREGDWKLIGQNSRLALHNLADDRPEAKNYAGDQPEIVNRLRGRYDAWSKDVTARRQITQADRP